MKTDRGEGLSGETEGDIERAHLREPHDISHEMFRYDVPLEFAGLLRRFWIPVWSVPAGRAAPQKVLQYPVCLLVVTQEYARFYGVTSGLSTTTLSGEGWAVGVMCEPAAGFLLSGASIDAYTDRHVPLTDVLGAHGHALVDDVRRAMAHEPRSPETHAAAMNIYTGALRRFLPVDAEGQLVNEIVAFVEGRSDVTRVAQICEAFDVNERSLQRLIHRRLGLAPKWLIQRRRLHDAVGRLRARTTTLANVATELGYADEPHFIRDFSRATGMTPGRFAAQQQQFPG